MSDWQRNFLPALRKLISGHNPYEIPGFYSPPWLLFILLPLAWFPWWVAMFAPGIALAVAAYYRRKWWLIPIVGLSFPFIALSAYANVDWVPLLGLALGGGIGPLLISTKPQAAGFALLAYLSRGKLLGFVPLLIAVIVSFILYPHWIGSMLGGSDIIHTERNLSLFPYSAPLGIIALVLTWTRRDVLWGAVASLCLTPYYYVPSLVPLLFLLADRKWWLGVLFSLSTWFLVWASLTGRIGVRF